LPREAIATRPARPRDSARLLDLTAGLAHCSVADLPALLQPGDMMVFNDTRVIPARLAGRRGEARVELTLHRRVSDERWQAFAKPARRLRPGDRIIFAEELSAAVEARDGPEVSLVFDRGGAALAEALQRHGAMPLPPYLRRDPDARDRDDYQTVYARREGAVAAPTAGLHFTDRLLHALDARGVARRFVTLHVGAGTFLPVSAEDTADHPMYAEWCELTPDTAAAINRCRASGGRIVAVGTTVVRLLESATRPDGDVEAFTGEVDLFIEPGYRFKAVDLMLTNFHLPRSTLFMLVCAFAGTERMKATYAEALAAGYRFYSYGDACLLARGEGP
ncbi:MAG: tRNA preQ1(34) S-adenosylmethionine ribosyltransferase-isomerase QueA, partial [Alphaproteobacteria bacterium]|nr:tRNA preQ1(34) S-adenosylmethionine ribosyltransferase-isomerase QueA [Alphaproteobacteria bacterium]